MTTTDKPPFDPVAAAAECMQWPTIAEAVRNYHNNDGFAETVFKLIHDDYTLAQAVEICDVLLKRGKYAEAPIEIERAPESLIGKRVRITNDIRMCYPEVGKIVEFDSAKTKYGVQFPDELLVTWWYCRDEFAVIEDAPQPAPVIKQPLAEIDALKKQIKNLEWTLRQIVTYTPDTEPDAMSEAYSAWTIRQIAELALGVHSAVQS